MSNIFIKLKKNKTCLGVLDIEEIRDKNNETSLKEGGGIEMSTRVLFHIRDARSLRHRNVDYSAFPYTRCTRSLYFRFLIVLPILNR